MLSVRRAEAAKADIGKEAAGLLRLASGRAATGAVVATTGIRGLDEEQLKAANYSEAGLAESDGYVTTAADAQAFAQRAKLQARKVDYLPAPERQGDAHE